MKNSSCYFTNPNIHTPLAQRFGWSAEKPKRGLSPQMVSSLHGMYDDWAAENGKEPLIPEGVTSLDTEEVEEVYRKLSAFRLGQKQETLKAVKDPKRATKAWDNLMHAFPLQQRLARINMLSQMFSEELDRLCNNAEVSREAVANGFTTTDGEVVGGPVAILESCYNNCLAFRQTLWRAIQPNMDSDKVFEIFKQHGYFQYYDAPVTGEAAVEVLKQWYNEYTKVLKFWDDFVPFIIKDLSIREGLKINKNKKYAVADNTNGYDPQDIAAKWEISESKKDGWMENSDMQSAIGSVGLAVRRIISTIPVVYSHHIERPDGTTAFVSAPKVDDLGKVVFMNPVEVHQRLVDYLQGMQDVNDMMDRLAVKEERNGKTIYQARIFGLQGLVDFLVSNPTARTQFYCDFRKIFQPYTKMVEDNVEGNPFLRKIKTVLLNKAKSMAVHNYKRFVSQPSTKYPELMQYYRLYPIIDDVDKTINWKNIAELHKLAKAWLYEDISKSNTADANEGVSGIEDIAKVYGGYTCPLLSRDPNTRVVINGKQEKITYDMKRDFLLTMFASLGFEVYADTVDAILGSKDIYKVRDALMDLFSLSDYNSGFGGIIREKVFAVITGNKRSGLTEEEAWEEVNQKKHTLKNVNFNEKSLDTIGTPIRRLLETVDKYQNGQKLENRVRYNGNTLFSNVAPNFMGDRFGAIQSFVNKDDKVGLRKFLKDNYLNSPFFVDEEFLESDGAYDPINKKVKGKIYNMWLSDLYNATFKARVPLAATVADVFSWNRDLGKEGKKFEDFTMKEHAIDMIVHYFRDDQIGRGYGKNKNATAEYPVFILGDAGVSKYIRAPRITGTAYKVGDSIYDKKPSGHSKKITLFTPKAQEEILEQFWNIYLQERFRMHADDALDETIFKGGLYANGKPVKRTREFSILTFLNPSNSEYNPKYAIPAGKENDSRVVKNIIREYLNDSAINGREYDRNGTTVKVPSFKQRLQEAGALETDKSGKHYKYIDDIANPKDIDDKIIDFYWNTKLATALQLQIMTIDPSFYHGSKDIQKRYKEIHAPGSALDIYAMYKQGNEYRRYSEDGIETCVYFKDIKINSEETNPDFMKTILRNFAQAESSKVEEAINDGIIEPKDDKAAEKQRQEKLKGLLGKNYGIYQTYCGNTLTDGQGYRTLEGYRKVMGMAGKWTGAMENAYNTIMAIREKHTVRDSEGKVIEHTDLTDEEITQLSNMSIVLQPIKPYMFTHEKVKILVDGKEREWLIPVQHKYAEAVLIPELLTKGSKLQTLAYWMSDNNIDMAGSDKIGKVGIFGRADITNANDKESMHSALGKAVVHRLPYSDYRIQTNVPEHINSSQLFGTQIRKLIMAGLNLRGDYSSYLGDQLVNLSLGGAQNTACRLTGSNLLALYNSLICANILDSYKTFAERAGNIEELSELLQDSTMMSEREVMDNIFGFALTGRTDDTKKFDMPLFEGVGEHDAAALILSIFKKVVNKQQIAGGSAVQVSAFGINGKTEDDNLRFVTDSDNPKNILYAEVERPFDLSVEQEYITSKGTKVKRTKQLSYDHYCFPDGHLLPTGKPLEKGTADWKKYQSYTYKEVNGKVVPCSYKDPEAKVYKPLIEAEYPDILSFIAYRIPTEKEYSMLNCRTVRFTSKVAGGTLKVPAEGTSIAGFDFDIDKLYFMIREFHETLEGDSYSEEFFGWKAKLKIWNEVYRRNPLVKDALEAAKMKAIGDERDEEKRAFLKFLPLTDFWKAAGIEEKYGINKEVIFKQVAMDLDLVPTVNNPDNAVKTLSTYDFTKAPEENSKANRNNLLITLMQARLMDPETMNARYTPGGFANASKAARVMRELNFGSLDNVVSGDNVSFEELYKREDDESDPEPQYDVTDPYTILHYNQQNQLAGKLIGIFANENTNHAFASLMNKFELNQPIEFCGHSFSDLLHKNNKEEAERVSLNMAEFLAASVDAVKDPVLNFLNLNTVTADAGALLARLGYTTEEIGLLFNQKVIKDLCEESLNKGISAVHLIETKRKELLTYTTGDNAENVALTKNELALNIIKERRSREAGKDTKEYMAENAKSQLAVLDLFSSILTATSDVSKFVLNTKYTAANAVKSTMGGLYAQQERAKEYSEAFPKSKEDISKLSYTIEIAENASSLGLLDMPIDADEAYLNMSKDDYLHKIRYNPFAYEQAMFDANRKIVRLLGRYFPYNTEMYSSARTTLNDLCLYGTLTDEEIDKVHSNLVVAALAKQEDSLFNGEGIHKKDGIDTGYTNRVYYREVFAKHLGEFLDSHPEWADAPIFKYLYPTSETVVMNIWKDKYYKGDPERMEKTIHSIEMNDIGGMGADLKQSVKESWAELLNSEDEDARDIAIDLFMYGFYQMGFDFSPFSFMHLAPVAVRKAVVVKRNINSPINSFKNKEITPNLASAPSNDVYVWSDREADSAERAKQYFMGATGLVGKLFNYAYQMPEGRLTPNDFRSLIDAARENPDLNFKVDIELTDEDIECLRFDELGYDIPSNIYFKENTALKLNDLGNAVSYGRELSYRDFLYGILDESIRDVDPKEFAIMFILNHLDDPRFVLDSSRVNTDLQKVFKEVQISPEGDITIDVSKYDEDAALGQLVSFNNGEYKWAMCIKYNNSYYMPVGYENINSSPKITYRKVNPLGASGTVNYNPSREIIPGYYNQEVPHRVSHQLAYTSSLDAELSELPWEVQTKQSEEGMGTEGSKEGSSISEPEEQEPVNGIVTSEQESSGQVPPADLTTPDNGTGNNGTFNYRQFMENALLDEIVPGYIKYHQDTINEWRRQGIIMSGSESEIRDVIKYALSQDNDEAILKQYTALQIACRDEDNILLLDADGNMQKGC